MSTLKDIKQDNEVAELIGKIIDSSSTPRVVSEIDDLIQRVHDVVIMNLWTEIMQHEELRKKRGNKHE